MTREKGVDLLADAFLRARRSEPRLHLLLAGGGPEEGELRERLGEDASFLGWLEGEDLAGDASADIFLFCSRTDTYGQVVLEAGASGLPVMAVAEGGPATLVENNHTGLLCQADADHLAGALLRLAASPLLRRRLGTSGVTRPGSAPGSARSSSSPPATGRPRAPRRWAVGKHLFVPPDAAWQRAGSQYDDWIDDPALFFNRELSWLSLTNCLELAEGPGIPAARADSVLAIYAPTSTSSS